MDKERNLAREKEVHQQHQDFTKGNEANNRFNQGMSGSVCFLNKIRPNTHMFFASGKDWWSNRPKTQKPTFVGHVSTTQGRIHMSIYHMFTESQLFSWIVEFGVLVVCLSGALKKGWPPVLMHK